MIFVIELNQNLLNSIGPLKSVEDDIYEKS